MLAEDNSTEDPMESTSTADSTLKDEVIFICDVCNTSFKSKSRLTHHRTIRHGFQRTRNRIRNYKCSVCQKRFLCQADLLAHSVTHSGQRPFQCDQCDKSFSHEFTLRRHSTTHSADQPFTCDQCGVKFKEVTSLHRHQRHLHEEGRAIRLQCTVCNKSFHSEKFLSRHKLLRHGAQVLESFDCPTCGKSFGNKHGLKLHQRIHTATWQDRQFECPYCHGIYRKRATIMSHQVAHKKGILCGRDNPQAMNRIAFRMNRIKCPENKDSIAKLDNESLSNESHHSHFVTDELVDSEPDPQSGLVSGLSTTRPTTTTAVNSKTEATTNSDDNKPKKKFGCNVCGQIFSGIDELEFRMHRASHRIAVKRVDGRKKVVDPVSGEKQRLSLPVTSRRTKAGSSGIAVDDMEFASRVQGGDEGSKSARLKLEEDCEEASLENEGVILTEFCSTTMEEEQIGIWDD